MQNKQITVKLVRSINKTTEKQRANVIGLGLRKIGDVKSLENTPSVRGMIKKVINWLEIK